MGKLSKKEVNKCYRNWITYALACQNFERMMAPAFVRMFGLVSKKLYNNPEDRKKLMKRHSQFFNTEEVFGAIIPGVILGMEEKKSEGEDIPDEVIMSTKTALMGPFAGMGDSLLGGTLRPILLSIALGLSASTGSPAGPIFYAVGWFTIVTALSYFLFTRGYKIGINAADFLFAGDMKNIITRAANIVGLIVVGAISAQYVSAKAGWEYVSGDMSITLQGILDGIFPNLLALALTLFAWYLLDKRKMKIGWVFGVFAGIATIGSLTGLLVL